MKRIIVFIALLMYTSAMCPVQLKDLDNRYSELTEQITQTTNQTELEQLKIQREKTLKQIRLIQGQSPIVVTNATLEKDLKAFKTWTDREFIIEDQPRQVVHLLESWFNDVKQTGNSNKKLQQSALNIFFVTMKHTRIKLELLRIGTFYSGKLEALVDVPLTSTQCNTVLIHVMTTLSDKLKNAWDSEYYLKKFCQKYRTHNTIVEMIVAKLPSSHKTSWLKRIFKRWHYALYKKLKHSRIGNYTYLSAKNAGIYDVLLYDVMAHHARLCQETITVLDAYASCTHDNKAGRDQCRIKLQRLNKKFEQLTQTLKQNNQTWDNTVAQKIVILLTSRLNHMLHVLRDYNQPGFLKTAQDCVLEMRDRLKMFFSEHSYLRKKDITDFFARYNKIIDRYKQNVLEGKKPSEHVLREVHSLVVALREYRPGFFRSWIWGNRTRDYFVDVMIETLETIDPRVKEPSFLEQFVERVLHSGQPNLSNKIVTNVLGSEVITDMALKQLKRLVNFLQNRQQGS